MSQIRQIEKSLRLELNNIYKANSMDTKKSYDTDQKTREFEEKLNSMEYMLNEEKKRNIELQKRCDDITSALGNERKIR